MVGVLTCQTTIFCINGLSTHEFEDSQAMQSVLNRAFKQTNLIKRTAVTGGEIALILLILFCSQQGKSYSLVSSSGILTTLQKTPDKGAQ